MHSFKYQYSNNIAKCLKYENCSSVLQVLEPKDEYDTIKNKPLFIVRCNYLVYKCIIHFPFNLIFYHFK